MHYLLQVPEFEERAIAPTTLEAAQERGGRGGARGVRREAREARRGERRRGQGYGDRLLSLVMLNVLDEKWKDHLYDLDQLRNAIHYRSWGQKDPLIEYKQEAYTMFVDLMNDISNTFTERFLKAQLVFEQAPPPTTGAVTVAEPARRRPARADAALQRARRARGRRAGGSARRRPDVDEVDGRRAGGDAGAREAARRDADPVIVGRGACAERSASATAGAPAPIDWSNVGRNDPCPCGSGKKFKKCHGATL